MIKRGVIFFNHGTKHIARLVVSIYSLRRVWPEASVRILDTGSPDAAEIIGKIGADDRLAAGVKQFKMEQLRRNSCYVAKASLWRHSPYDASLLVDSDTLFLRSPQPLIELVADTGNPGFLLTAFAGWNCAGRIISGRLEKWKNVKFPGLDLPLVIAQAATRESPAINTGVVGMRRDATTQPTLEAWERLTIAGCRNPWTDELAAQIIAECYPRQIVPEIWNSSVLYAKDRENAAIVHHHGGKNLRPEDGGRWLAAYRECLAAGLADIQHWGARTDAKLAGVG